MSKLFHRNAAPPASAALLPLACALLAAPAQAAGTPPPQLAPASPFEHYQRWREAPLQDWREVNARVGEIGGWRTYARESMPGATKGHDHSPPGTTREAP